MRTNEQMELEIVSGRQCPSVNRRQRRLRRASWWFDRMRRLVDRARQWPEHAPAARPEQIWFPE